jgi:hypothetical protein
MVACRVFAAGVAVLGLTAASASAQCCSGSYGGVMPVSYAAPVVYSAPVSGCCGTVAGVSTAPIGYASTGIYQPVGMSGTVVASNTPRRGLFGRFLGGRRSSQGVVTAGYMGTPTVMPISPVVSTTGFTQPITMGMPAMVGGMTVTGMSMGETIMPASASVIGSPALTPAVYGDFGTTGSVLPVQGMVHTQPIMPATVVMPASGVMPVQTVAVAGCCPTIDPCCSTTTTTRARGGLFSRFRR